nr:serine hydrolase [uncultured Niameybacter sp.]
MRKRVLLPIIGCIWLCMNICLFANTPYIEAEGAILIEGKTNTVLYQKNAYTKFYPASITKVLTALLVEESLNKETIITKSEESVRVVPADSSSIGLKVGERYTVKEGLYGLMAGSDNFIAHDLAKASKGSIGAFAKWMNEEAKACGATNTHFTNPHGYHDPNHYTTPYDMAQIARKAFNNAEVLKAAKVSQYTFCTQGTNRSLEIYNKNRLIKKGTPYYNPSVVAAKTGFHDDAKQTLVAKAVYGDMELIAVVMKTDSPKQYIDINKLFQYGQENFSVEKRDGTFKLTNLSASSWARELMNMAVERKWVVEKGENYQNPIPIAEFIYMLNSALTIKEKISLDNVKDILGKQDLDKGDSLTRLEASKIVQELFRKEGWTKPIQAINPYIPDIQHMTVEDRETITFMVRRQILGNKEVPFRPSEKLTWQEAVAMVVRMI